MAARAEQTTLILIKTAPLSGSGPLYLQVADALGQLIADGKLKRGAAMPRVRDLAEHLSVSIVTAAHAYRVLGERGRLAGRPGVGTYVADPPARPADPPPPDAQSLVWQDSFRVLEQLVQAKDVIDRGSDVFPQLVLRRLFEAGSIARQDSQMRRQWADQLTAMLGALERCMPQSVRWTRPRAGGSVWITMPDGCSSEALLARALEKNISFIPGRAFSVTDRHERAFRLAIGTLSPAQIMEGVKRLGAIVTNYVAEAVRGRPRAAIAKVS